MKKLKIKQGTLAWEQARQIRIGSSEIFDIIKYYATTEELQNCGINSEQFREEKPYTTAWALYHKIKQDGLYHSEELPPELADYGHAVEPYGLSLLQQERQKKLKAGEVYGDERLIASLDIEGVSEECDVRPFDYGGGEAQTGKKFVCEQKSLMPAVIKKGLPIKYILQAQYQITITGADFFILQLMVLNNDTVYERGYITALSKSKRREYLKDKMKVTHLYFRNNEHLAALIKTCIDRFFDDVENDREPTPFIAYDNQKNVIESLRRNSYYNDDLILDYDLVNYLKLKKQEEQAIADRKAELQKIVELAKENNASRFKCETYTAQFDKAGRFLVKELKND